MGCGARLRLALASKRLSLTLSKLTLAVKPHPVVHPVDSVPVWLEDPSERFHIHSHISAACALEARARRLGGLMADTRILPVLPLRDIVVYPKMAAPLFVGREKSVRALDEVMKGDKQILLAAQMDASEDEPAADRIFTVGTVATVVQLLKLPDGTVRVLVEGGDRAKIVRFTGNSDYF